MKTLSPDDLKVTNALLVSLTTNLHNQADFTAGALGSHLQNWSALTSDSYILNTVQGFKLDLLELPFQYTWPNQLINKPHEISVTQALLNEYYRLLPIHQALCQISSFVRNAMAIID